MATGSFIFSDASTTRLFISVIIFCFVVRPARHAEATFIAGRRSRRPLSFALDLLCTAVAAGQGVTTKTPAQLRSQRPDVHVDELAV